MKLQLIILLTFAWINLFASSDNINIHRDDTTKMPINIIKTSRIFGLLMTHMKYDELEMLRSSFADTLHIVINRQMFICNPSFALEKIEAVRRIIKNNDYKFSLKTIEEDTHRFTYLGYFNHEKYEVNIDFIENNNMIVFIAIVISAMDE